jgi:predicted lipoprotein with Yx(FWY)xxD motif
MKPKHLLISLVVLAAAALVLAACGSSSDDGGSSASSSAPASSGASSSGGGKAATVSVSSVDGVGDVLVDAQGMALYTPDQEASGKIVCTGDCESFWMPLQASGKPTADGDAGKLGVIRRPDGTMQVSANGKPLYTFSEDSAGQVSGDGFSDSFGGHDFTWHAVMAGGQPSSSASGAAGGGGGSSGDGYSSGSGY